MAERRLPVGAEVQPGGGVHFRVWAPVRTRVEVVFDGPLDPVPLDAEGNGYFAGTAPRARAGARYKYRLDGGNAFPDPASRSQPDGPHGPSQVIDPSAFAWPDAGWTGVKLEGQVLYELHVGTFTQEGTFAAAVRELPELAACGVTCLEVMPVAEFAGRFGWGYDGVFPFAPTRLYGPPDDFRRFVAAAHAAGLGVILDAVYNHLGPDGNHFKQFSPAYFTDRYETEWGEAINYDGPDAGPVREFFAANAGYWIDEFRLDGLRLDATQNVYDDAPPDRHILTEIGRRARAAANGRSILIVNENEPQRSELCRPTDHGGYGLDALWNDDFHHAAAVALTGRTEAYYADYRGTPQEFVSAAKYGYLYQGQWYSWQQNRRGTPGFDLPPAAFVNFIQNHDQVANSGRGLRLHQLTSAGRYRAMTALTLLGPGTPMLFQGQEFAASAPFLYFADHKPELAKLVRAGRVEFLRQFRSLTDPEMRSVLAGPDDPATFERCKLDFGERERNAPAYRLVKDLLKLRREDPAFRGRTRGGVDGAVIGEQAFVLRFFRGDGHDRLLVVNLGRDLYLTTCPEPLIAPPAGMKWANLLATEDPKYGGGGATAVDTPDDGWWVGSEAAVVLEPVPAPPVGRGAG